MGDNIDTENLELVQNVQKINTGLAPKKIPHPWHHPMAPTPEMKRLANLAVRCVNKTNKFILEIEGPTQVESSE